MISESRKAIAAFIVAFLGPIGVLLAADTPLDWRGVLSAFVAGGTTDPLLLVNDGFWPDIDAEKLRAAQRIASDVTNERLEVAAVAAMISVNRELHHLKFRHLAAGHTTLEAVPADQIAQRLRDQRDHFGY